MNRIIFAAIAAALASPALAQNTFDFRTDHNSPKLVAPNGQYLGNLNNNPFDRNSVNNPFGQYGNPFSNKSINNQFSPYGNPYSPQYSNPYGRR